MAADRIAAIIEAQGPNLALWVPVLFAAGIAIYFSLPFEPAPWMLAAMAGGLMVGTATCFRLGPMGRVLLIGAMLPGLGIVAGGLRSIIVAAPVIGYERTATVEGRVIGLTRSASNLPRVLLDRVVIYGLDPSKTPATIRVSLAEGTDPAILAPGKRVTGVARLSPPGGPGEPGGFDFRAIAWFDRLGAVGYARTPMLEVEGSDASIFHQMAFRARMALSAHIQALVPGRNGAFGSAILTGDRSGIDREVEADLRVSTLYHLVSISGLHMSLLAAAIFAIVRYGLAIIPWCALRWPLKKIAAVFALIGGAAYLVISGSDVATQRSYVMTAVVLVAVLLDRPAITLRSIALAALVVLSLAPESLTQAGFQMSFAATIALIAGFEGLRGLTWWQATQTDRRWRFARPVIGIAMTSLVAGTATAPISAFHFNTLAQYGLLANLLGVPAMGVVVMPAAVVGLILAPFGLDWLPFTIMGWGIGYILEVAAFVSGMGGAVVGVKSGPGISLALLMLGGVFLVLWRGRARWAGVAPMALALLLWALYPRPDVIVADNGRLFGVMTAEGRALSVDKGNNYAAESWLENDGDTATQAEAAARGAFDRRRARIETEVPGLGPIVYVGATDQASGARECAAAAVLIAPKWYARPSGRCLFIGAATLRHEGAQAIWIDRGHMTVEGALANTGRPWTRDPDDGRRRRDPGKEEPGPKSVASR